MNTDSIENSELKYKNIAAVLDESITTISVIFEQGGRVYNYKATKELASTLIIGDFVVVQDKDALAIAEVVDISEECTISPESTIDYKWAFHKVDIQSLSKLLEVERSNIEILKESHKKQIRQRFRDMYSIEGVSLISHQKGD